MKLLVMLLFLIPSLAQANDPVIEGSAENPTTLSKGPVAHVSQRGEFRVVFPSGCGKLVTKVPSDAPETIDGLPAVAVTLTYCDRNQEKGEGCSVSSFFNVMNKDGGPPGSEQVIERVVRVLDTMNVSISHEMPVSKTLPDGALIEGLEVLASDPSGVGQTWVRGLLFQGDIYIMSAWKNTGQLWDDPEYQNFFNSFQPGAID